MFRVSDLFIIVFLCLMLLGLIAFIVYLIKFKKKGLLISSILLFLIGIIGIPSSIVIDFNLKDRSERNDDYLKNELVSSDYQLSGFKNPEIERWEDGKELNPNDESIIPYYVPYNCFIKEGIKYFSYKNYGFYMDTYKELNTYYSELFFYTLHINWKSDRESNTFSYQYNFSPSFSALYKIQNDEIKFVKELGSYHISSFRIYTSVPYEECNISEVKFNDTSNIVVSDIKGSKSTSSAIKLGVGLNDLNIYKNSLSTRLSMNKNSIDLEKNIKQLSFKVTSRNTYFNLEERITIDIKFNLDNVRRVFSSNHFFPTGIAINFDHIDNERYFFDSLPLSDINESKTFSVATKYLPIFW